MVTSQNGYTASPTLDGIPSGVVRIHAHGSDAVFTVRKDISQAFQYLIDNYHERVESIDLYAAGDDWSYAYRPVRGETTGLSNHASATAIDINATLHPVGVPTDRNLTAQQIAEVHEILDELSNVIRWGGDYVNRPDAMHFEINASVQEVQNAVNRIEDNQVTLLNSDVDRIAAAVMRAIGSVDIQPGEGEHTLSWYARSAYAEAKQARIVAEKALAELVPDPPVEP